MFFRQQYASRNDIVILTAKLTHTIRKAKKKINKLDTLCTYIQ